MWIIIADFFECITNFLVGQMLYPHQKAISGYKEIMVLTEFINFWLLSEFIIDKSDVLHD